MCSFRNGCFISNHACFQGLFQARRGAFCLYGKFFLRIFVYIYKLKYSNQ